MVFCSAVPKKYFDAVRADAKARVLLGDVVGDDEVEVFLREFAQRICLDVLGLGGKADEDLTRLCPPELQ